MVFSKRIFSMKYIYRVNSSSRFSSDISSIFAAISNDLRMMIIEPTPPSNYKIIIFHTKKPCPDRSCESAPPPKAQNLDISNIKGHTDLKERYLKKVNVEVLLSNSKINYGYSK